MVSVDTEANPIPNGPMEIYFVCLFLGGIIMVLLNMVSYVQVSKQSKRLFNRIKDTSLDEANKVLQKEKKLGKMVALMNASFGVVYIPLIIVQLDVNSFSRIPIIIAYFCSYLVVVMDPLVYIYCNEKYCNEIKMILKSIPFVSRILNCKDNPTSA